MDQQDHPSLCGPRKTWSLCVNENMKLCGLKVKDAQMGNHSTLNQPYVVDMDAKTNDDDEPFSVI